MTTSRRALLAAIGLALPAVALTATDTLAATTSTSHKAKPHHSVTASHTHKPATHHVAHKAKSSHVAQVHRSATRKPVKSS